MKRILLFCSLWLAATVSANSMKITDKAQEIVLDNGMRVVLLKHGQAPMVAAGWVAHVGSANERPGITGISHLFEHMMFKGTPTIGTKDYKLDSEIRQQLDQIREKMFALERQFRDQVRRGLFTSLSDAAQTDKTYQELKKQFDALLAKQRQNMVKDEFDQIYTKAGANRMNAFTNHDMTVYFIQVPKNKLELWFWMESERLLHPVFREFYSERDVVYEERRMRTESTPTGVQDEVFESLFWRGHPYSWPVVGWPSDIAAITRQQAESYYDLYYAANNLTAVIVGDIDIDQAKQLAEKYFGRLKGKKTPPPDVVTMRTPQSGTVIYRAEVDDNASATLAYATTAFAGEDEPALSVLASVLNGRTGKLYKELVLNKKIATDVYAMADSRKYGGSFRFYAQGGSEAQPEVLRDALLAIVDEIKQAGVTQEELERVKNQMAASRFRQFREPFRLMIELLYVDGLRDWHIFDDYSERLLAVTTDDIKRVANKYFTQDNLAIKLYARKKDSAPEDPALAGLSGKQKAMVKQMLSQIENMPAEQLPNVLAQLEANAEKAPKEAKPVIKVLTEKIKARLEAQDKE